MLNCTSKNSQHRTVYCDLEMTRCQVVSNVIMVVSWWFEHWGFCVVTILQDKFWSSKFLSFFFNLFVLLFIFSFLLFFVPPECFLVRSGLVSGLTNDLLSWLKKYYLQLWLANLHGIHKAVEQDHSYLFVEFITAIL